MRTDGHDEANSRFSQFCERAEQCIDSSLHTHKHTHIYNDIALNTATCFGPQVTNIRQSNKVMQRKNKSVASAHS